MVLLELKKIFRPAESQCGNCRKEIASIKSCMEDAPIQICKFYILQALTREVRKTALAQSERKLLISLCRKLVYAKTETYFEGYLANLTRQATAEFLAYYNKILHSVKKLWASYFTNNAVNLGNTTNNRTESHNEKIKSILTRNRAYQRLFKAFYFYTSQRLLQLSTKILIKK